MPLLFKFTMYLEYMIQVLIIPSISCILRIREYAKKDENAGCGYSMWVQYEGIE